MINKELIEQYRKIVKPIVASRLLKTNYEGMGEQDKEEFERDFDEILDLALIGLEYKSITKDATSDLISRQAVSSWLKQYGQDVLHGKYKFSLMYIWKNLMELPSARPERKTGHWIRVAGMNDIFETEKIKLITSGRRTGRTLKLIEECAKYNYALIVCPNFNMARCTFELAQEMGYNIPCPITFSEFATGKFYGKNIDAFLFDNLEITLQHLARGVPVKMRRVREKW